VTIDWSRLEESDDGDVASYVSTWGMRWRGMTRESGTGSALRKVREGWGTPFLVDGDCSVARLFFRLLVGFCEVFACFFQGALGVVIGLQGLAVFISGALALSGHVENLA
jgi:hypothetical protein